jgi:hypothetical protein
MRGPELIKISIAGLAGAVLAEENCRIWVMQQITWELNPAGPPASREQHVCTIPEINSSIYNHRLYIKDEARFYDEFMIVYHDARALISRLRDLLRAAKAR